MASIAALNLIKRSIVICQPTTTTNLLLISSTTTSTARITTTGTIPKPNCYVPSRGFGSSMFDEIRRIEKDILGYKYEDLSQFGPEDDIGHWLFQFSESHLRKYHTDRDLYDYFVKFLAPAVGGEEEAKERIYYCNTYPFCKGFCAKIDADTKEKLRVVKGVRRVDQDYDFNVRDKWTVPDPE